MTCIRCNGSGRIAINNTDTSLPCTACLPGVRYAGIGSRATPLPVWHEMTNIAMQLALRGFVLRSGAAKPLLDAKGKPVGASADLAFEKGCSIVNGRKVIRVATQYQPAMDHAAQFHPNWSACDEYARALHARNSLIMLGDWLDDPVSFVVCWTEGGAVKGGTGQALRIANAMNIPVFNLAVTPAASLWSWLDGK